MEETNSKKSFDWGSTIGWVLVCIGVVILIVLKFSSLAVPLLVYDLSNSVVIVGFIIALVRGVKIANTPILSRKYIFFKVADGSFHRLPSASSIFITVFGLLFMVFGFSFMDMLSNRYTWFAYTMQFLAVVVMLMLGFLMVFYIIELILYISSPYKGVLYKWVTLRQSPAQRCHTCDEIKKVACYGEFSVSKRKDQSLWRWMFNPHWRSLNGRGVCSKECLMQALERYAQTVRNL